MRCDLQRILRNAAPCSALRKHPQRTRARFPHGLTARRVSCSARMFCAEEAAQPIKGYSSETTARDSLRPRVVKSQPVIKRTRLPHRRRHPPSAAGWVAMPLCKTVARQAIEPSQLPGVLPLAIDADGRTLGGTGAPFLRQWVQPHRLDARTSTTSQCQQLS
jgi:hypothetical protein